jgi:D-glycerate 3-kinase
VSQHHPIAVLIYEIIQKLRVRNPDRPALIGVSGAQGSGKSFQCRLLAMANQPRFAHFSLDDVYTTLDERREAALDVHPLCQTRGPPGTHELELASQTFTALTNATPATATALPKFDKARDDRAPVESWPIFKGAPEAILFDGWCLGALPIDGAWDPPLNWVEAQDREGAWRLLTRAALRDEYQPFFAAFDAMIYLQAPTWEIVRSWRGQQEEQTLGRSLTAQENANLDRFVQFYERITRSMLSGHHSAKWIVHMDEARKVTRIEER